MGGACLLDTPPKSYIPSTHQLSVEHKLMSLSWWIPSLHLAHSHQLYQKCTQQNAFKLSDNCQWRQNEFLQKQHNSFQGRRSVFKIGRDILKSTKPMQNAFTYTMKLPVKADQFLLFRVCCPLGVCDIYRLRNIVIVVLTMCYRVFCKNHSKDTYMHAYITWSLD